MKKDCVKETKTKKSEKKENLLLTPKEYHIINAEIANKMKKVKKEWGLEKITNEQSRILYRAMNHDIKIMTGVKTRSKLEKKQYEVVLKLIKHWEPTRTTIALINQQQIESYQKKYDQNIWIILV